MTRPAEKADRAFSIAGMSCSYFKTLATSASDKVRVIGQWLLPLSISRSGVPTIAVICEAAYVGIWHIASFRCALEFRPYRGMTDFDKPSTRQIMGSRPAERWI